MMGDRGLLTAILGWATIAAVLVVVVMPAHADGGVFASGMGKLPDIPQQTALIRYKDGVETLIVQTSIDGEGDTFVWLLPVPSSPTSFELASPGFFEMLPHCFSPYIRLGYAPGWRWVFFPAAVVLLWLVFFCFYRPKYPLRTLLLLPVLGVTLFGLFKVYEPLPDVSYWTPGDGTRSGIAAGAQPHVRVEQEVEVGNYSLTVLQSDSYGHLNTWLAQNGFSEVPGHGREAVERYVRQGWRFIVVQFSRNGDGFSRPEPLAVTFETPDPVYPMALTGLAGADLHLDLFVIAWGEARSGLRALRRDFADVFEPEDYMDEDVFYGSETGEIIGYPPLLAHMWDHCVVTRLTGVLTPIQMRQDIALSMHLPKPHRRTHWTTDAGWRMMLSVSLLAWSIAALVTAVYVAWKAPGQDTPEMRWAIPVGLIYLFYVPGAALGLYPSEHWWSLVPIARATLGLLPLEYWLSLVPHGIIALGGLLVVPGAVYMVTEQPTRWVPRPRAYAAILVVPLLFFLGTLGLLRYRTTLVEAEVAFRVPMLEPDIRLLEERPQLLQQPPDIVARYIAEAISAGLPKGFAKVRVAESPGNFVLIQDERGLVFRAFATEGWGVKGSYYDTILALPEDYPARTGPGLPVAGIEGVP